MQNHKYSLSDIDSMIPWEREIYVGMLTQDLKEQADRHRAESMRR